MVRAACDGHYGNENWEFNADVEAPTNCQYQRSDDLCKRAQAPRPDDSIPERYNVARVRYWHLTDVDADAQHVRFQG